MHINQSINQPINQSINQSINQPTNQPTNQSINANTFIQRHVHVSSKPSYTTPAVLKLLPLAH